MTRIQVVDTIDQVLLKDFEAFRGSVRSCSRVAGGTTRFIMGMAARGCRRASLGPVRLIIGYMCAGRAASRDPIAWSNLVLLLLLSLHIRRILAPARIPRGGGAN